MNRFILTNNPKVLASYPAARWIDGGPDKVLLECRRMVHEFYPLLTHPLMGDVRLIRNPFRTVLFGEKRREVDPVSLIFIEESIDILRRRFREDNRVEHSGDYQIVDFDLFQTAIASPSPLPLACLREAASAKAGERDACLPVGRG